MGNINLKLKVKMTDECADGVNCLVTNISAYTDGYSATVKLTLDTDVHTPLTAADGNEILVAMGRHGTTNCDKTKCSQGFFNLQGEYANTGTLLDTESYW